MATRIHFDVDMADSILDDAAMAILTTKVRQMVANTSNDALDQKIRDCCDSTARDLALGFGSRFWGSGKLQEVMREAIINRTAELGINEQTLVDIVTEKVKAEFQNIIDESVRRCLAGMFSGTTENSSREVRV